MAEEKGSAKSASKTAEQPKPDALKESDAQAPGPITAEHESGSWDQTLDEQEAREAAQERRSK